MNYFTWHVLFICVESILGGAVLYVIEGNEEYIDTLFMAVSATSETGLATINLSTMNSASQVVVWLLVLLSGVLLGATIPPSIRILHLGALAENDPKALKESKALKCLVMIVIFYWALCQFVGFVTLALYCSLAKGPRLILEVIKRRR